MNHKINHAVFIFISLIIMAIGISCKNTENGKETNANQKILAPPAGEYAPEDAFLHGCEHAYYGALNPWNLRFFYGYFDNWTKRRGQRLFIDLIDNKFEETESYANELLKRNPDDLEALFNLAVSLAYQNRLDEAMQIVKKSIELGLPFERYLAGPRDVLKPLTESNLFKKYAAGFNLPVLHGPMLGRVTDQTASFWVRTAEEANVQVVLSKGNTMINTIVSDKYRTEANKDYTCIVTVGYLEPNTRYYYQVIVNNELVKDLGVFSFLTYPDPGSGSQFCVAFGGGGGFTPENERIYSVIKDNHPLAFLGMGDNVYIDLVQHANHPLAMQRYTYYRRQSRPEFRNLVSSVSIYAIWDDHEFTDDVWLGPYKHIPFWKMPLFEQFRENWINPSYGTKEYPGCWHKFSIGDVDFFMLDGRFYRTSPYDKEPTKANNFAKFPTMLGPAQKEWLFEELKKSKATFKVIASPVPWAYEAKPGELDTWNGFHEERDEIFNYFTENNIDGIVLLSADRHRSDAWKIERTDDYPLYEFESSRLTNEDVDSIVEGALFGYNDKQSFGLLSFDTSVPDPTLTYKIYSIDNEEVYSLTINKSQLRDK